MKCFHCKTKDVVVGYICDKCLAATAKAADEAEAAARTVDCPSCHQAAGAPCLSGSGVERAWSHATRTKLARKLRRNRKDRV